MGIRYESGRQEVVAAIVDFSHEDVENGEPSKAVYLPTGAIVVAGFLAVSEAFNSATSDVLDLGDDADEDRYLADANLAEEGVTPLEIDGEARGQGDFLHVTWNGEGAAPTAGSARLIVQYVVEGRAAFAHGPDKRVER